MTTPTIHLNGSSGADLRDQYAEAMSAVRGAVDAVAAAGPNARDYYPQGEHAFAAARAEHVARLEALRNVHHELELLAVHCDAHAKDRR